MFYLENNILYEDKTYENLSFIETKNELTKKFINS